MARSRRNSRDPQRQNLASFLHPDPPDLWKQNLASFLNPDPPDQ